MERLQKVMARRGVASRRQCETMIVKGRVTVNGMVQTELGCKVDPEKDRIEVDGKPLVSQKPMYILLHKPPRYITSKNDPQNRPTVMDLLPPAYSHLHPVGRLDWGSEGLLFLTNDGEFTFGLTHPSHEIPKTYLVHTDPSFGPVEKALFARGIALDQGVMARGKVVIQKQQGNTLPVLITVYQGKNRQIRRMMKAVQKPVYSLKRLSVGPVKLGSLPRGKYRNVSHEEVRALKKMMGL